MSKSIQCVLWLCFLIPSLQAQQVEHITLQSQALQQEREISIYTPLVYQETPYLYFDVFYVFDAQNREFFDYVHSLLSFYCPPRNPFIVVGIKSNQNQDLEYARNNDLLPVLTTQRAKDYYGPYAGNIENFRAYVRDEVMPYVETHYRTYPRRTAIGHSLSASFVLYSLTQDPGLFNNYLAVSPNLAYEDDLMAKAMLNFDYSLLQPNTFLYVSSADEENYWPHWLGARKKVHAFLQKKKNVGNVTVLVNEYPDKDHREVFPTSLGAGIEALLGSVYDSQKPPLSAQAHSVTIRVQVPNPSDELYIVGNQPALGDWDPGRVKMEKTGPRERSITLPLQSLAELKFTRGSWQSEASVKDGLGANLMIAPEAGKTYTFEVLGYGDDQGE
ncbi:MAG TPA: esterase [Cytophagales bacterium]|nr:esterase [Cytophagales bacterium]HAA20604.1 esterase [Cytophagales bacterium]HAP63349.1 esterase [Cytophagales bacterium]